MTRVRAAMTETINVWGPMPVHVSGIGALAPHLDAIRRTAHTKIPLSATFGVIWSYLAVMLAVVVVCIVAPALVRRLPGLSLLD